MMHLKIGKIKLTEPIIKKSTIKKMACQFEIPFSGAATVAVSKARSAVESMSGIFNGDEYSGDFDLNVFGNDIKGNYTISGQLLKLEVTDKPFFVPCSTIESFLKKQIS